MNKNNHKNRNLKIIKTKKNHETKNGKKNQKTEKREKSPLRKWATSTARPCARVRPRCGPTRREGARQKFRFLLKLFFEKKYDKSMFSKKTFKIIR